jgi:hypothetical protein
MAEQLRRLRIKLLPFLSSTSPIAVIALAVTLLATAAALHSTGRWRHADDGAAEDSARMSLAPSFPMGKPGEREGAPRTKQTTLLYDRSPRLQRGKRVISSAPCACHRRIDSTHKKQKAFLTLTNTDTFDDTSDDTGSPGPWVMGGGSYKVLSVCTANTCRSAMMKVGPHHPKIDPSFLICLRVNFFA